MRLSHRREPSGRTVHEEVGGLDNGGQHGRRYVLLRHTHMLQRKPYLICTSRSGSVRPGAEAVKLDSRCFWEGLSGSVGASVGDESTQSLKIDKEIFNAN